MSGDLALQMYEAQAELVETRQELERIRRERDELKNQVASSHLTKTIDDFQRNYSNRFESIEANLRMLTTNVSNNNQAFVEIRETLKDLKAIIQVQRENEKSLINDHAKLSETVRAIQFNFNTLSIRVSRNDQILSGINETLRKQNQTLMTHAKTLNESNQMNRISTDTNKDIQVPKKSREIMKKKTILVLGGRSGNTVIDSLLLLQNDEGDNGNWKQLNIKLPYPIWGHGAQFLNNTLYIFGGRNEKNEVLSSSYKLTGGHKWLNSSLQWDKMKDMNQKRTEISNSNVILNDRIWVVGGYNGNNPLKCVEMYDPQTNIWTNMKEMNERRGLAAAAVVNGQIFCCGGHNGTNYLKSAEYHDPSSDTWTPIFDMPGPNGGCGIMVIDAHLIVIGGRVSKEKFLSSIWVLDTVGKNRKWIEKEPRLSRPLCDFSIAKIDDKIFVCGGVYIDKNNFKVCSTNAVEIFNEVVWRNGPRMPTSLKNSAVVVISMELARFFN